MNKPMWRVTAGRGGRFIDQFRQGNFVSLGWQELGDPTRFSSKDDMLAYARKVFVDQTARQQQVGVGQVWRFIHGISEGDWIVTYDPGERIYCVGHITGAAEYAPSDPEEYQLKRPVDWQGTVLRDDLSQGAKNSLGAIQTIIQVPGPVAQELLTRLGSLSGGVASREESEEETGSSFGTYDALAEQALVRIEDQILKLDWDQMQDLVAALLRSLGYRTVVSPAGPDRGKDIIASRDGLGFERPRIVVEVKHRRHEKMGAPDIRAFLGGRHNEDRGLYVSTGGFSQDARYEADRATMPTHLLDLRGLAEAVIANYSSFDEQGRALLRLRPLYWPYELT